MKPEPAPQIIDGEVWSIRDSGSGQAFVDFSTNLMVVPLGDSPGESLIRAHETAHVKISPREIPELSSTGKILTQAIEDARVYSFLNSVGIETDKASPWSENQSRTMERLSYKDPIFAVGSYIASRRTKFRLDYLPEDVKQQVDSVLEPLFEEYEKTGDYPPFEVTLQVAKTLEELWEASEESPGEGEGEGKPEETSGDAESGSGEAGEDSGEATKETPREMPKPKNPLGDTRKENPGSKDGRDAMAAVMRDISQPIAVSELPQIQLTSAETQELTEMGVTPVMGTAYSAEMIVRNYPLEVPLTGKSRLKGIKKAACDTGAIPRRMNRYATDSAIFSRTVKRGRAVILIDCSGSMSLSSEDITEVLEAVPDATVALYNGRGSEGYFVIAANERKSISPENLYSFMFNPQNAVDRPALEWLAKQTAKPKFWVCDGIVTGRSDGRLIPSEMLAIKRAIKQGRINRVENLEELFDHPLFRKQVGEVKRTRS